MQIVTKVPNGKLLKINLDLQDTRIQKISLRGDFFMYPEETITDLEDFLLGQSVDNNLSKLIEDFLLENQVQVYGFTAQDLEDILMQQI
ncbi:hypothetical protein HOH51_02525 [bacterium]|jgi:lipoate-protein ligase A|nr:hypothetical protein [bacterium]